MWGPGECVHPYITSNYSKIGDDATPKHALYRFFDDAGKLLYIGETSSPDRRFEWHRRHGVGPWHQIASITVDWLESREVARVAERDAIRAEKPAWNVVHNNHVMHEPGTIIGIAVVKYRKPIAHVGVVLSWDKKTMTMRELDGPGGNQKTIKLSDIQCLRTGSVEAVRAFKHEWEDVP